jgi:hypothetical protein
MMGRIGEEVPMIFLPAMEFLFYFLAFGCFLLFYFLHFLLLPESTAENIPRRKNKKNVTAEIAEHAEESWQRLKARGTRSDKDITCKDYLKAKNGNLGEAYFGFEPCNPIHIRSLYISA